MIKITKIIPVFAGNVRHISFNVSDEVEADKLLEYKENKMQEMEGLNGDIEEIDLTYIDMDQEKHWSISIKNMI